MPTSGAEGIAGKTSGCSRVSGSSKPNVRGGSAALSEHVSSSVADERPSYLSSDRCASIASAAHPVNSTPPPSCTCEVEARWSWRLAKRAHSCCSSDSTEWNGEQADEHEVVETLQRLDGASSDKRGSTRELVDVMAESTLGGVVAHTVENIVGSRGSRGTQLRGIGLEFA